jgi:hypothetical protein
VVRRKLKFDPALSLFEITQYLFHFVEGFLGIATLSAAILKNFFHDLRCASVALMSC